MGKSFLANKTAEEVAAMPMFNRTTQSQRLLEARDDREARGLNEPTYNEGFASGEGNTVGTNNEGTLYKELLPNGEFKYQFRDHSGNVRDFNDLESGQAFLEGRAYNPSDYSGRPDRPSPAQAAADESAQARMRADGFTTPSPDRVRSDGFIRPPSTRETGNTGGIADAQTDFDTSPEDMLKRIMSEKDNMELDFNGNGRVTPEDARVYAMQQGANNYTTAPKDMLSRIMSEKDNMALDFNGNGRVTPEDARVYAQQQAEQQTTTSATTPVGGGIGGAAPSPADRVTGAGTIGTPTSPEGIMGGLPPAGDNATSPEEMLKRIMSEKDNMELDFNGNGQVTPEDARVYAQQRAETTAKEALNIAVGNAPYDERFDQNNDGKVTPGEARNIAAGEFVPTAAPSTGGIPPLASLDFDTSGNPLDNFGSDPNVTSTGGPSGLPADPNPNNFNYNEGFESGEGNTIGTNDKGVLAKNFLPDGKFEYQFIDHSGKVVENFGTDLDNAKGFLEGKPPTTAAPITPDPITPDPDPVFDTAPETIDPITTVPETTVPETVAPTVPETTLPETTLPETIDPIEEIPVAAPPQIGEEGNPGITSFGDMSANDLQRQLSRGNIAPDNVANAQARITQLENEQFTKPQGILGAPGLTQMTDERQRQMAALRQRQMAEQFNNLRFLQGGMDQTVNNQNAERTGGLGGVNPDERQRHMPQHQIDYINSARNASGPHNTTTAGDISGGLGGVNPDGMSGAGQGGFQFPMQGQQAAPAQTPYQQPANYGMTMDRHGVQSPTYNQNTQMPQPPAGNYGTPPSQSGYDTSNSTYGVNTPQLPQIYGAKPAIAGFAYGQ